MEKLLPKNLHRLKYALSGLSLQFLFIGVSYAADIKHPDKNLVKHDLFAGNFYHQNQTNPTQTRSITGKVTLDDDRQGAPGVTVFVKGTSTGVTTDTEGNYSLDLPAQGSVLVFSFIGYVTKEVAVGNQTKINVALASDTKALEEVVIVGYGEQKRESVVAAITQTKGAVLERAGGVQSIGAALTGNVPGVVTMASSGMPGEEDPRILIRGSSTWNNSSPLILVDGIERPMNSVDISSVEAVSVLKDASATAVYGVRGANGVILITTKRGVEGKALIRARVQTTVKSPSKLPGKFNSYDTYQVRNQAIENELALKPDAWNSYMPQAFIEKYRNPANQEERERYPDVDWQKELFKDYAMAYNASLNISGGTKLVKYFTSADYLQENDLFKVYDNHRGYKGGYGFNRMNVRSNLDFQLTPTTTLKSNLSGSYGVSKKPMARANEFYMWAAAYGNAPDAFYPQYSDGSWGYYAPLASRAENSMRNVSISGVEYITNTRLNTDFTLEQNLNKWVKGLKFAGTIAFDNAFIEGGRGINDANNTAQEKYIDPVTGIESYRQAFDTSNRFDFQEAVAWTTSPGSVTTGERRVFYQAQLNYATTLAQKHNITSLALVNRNAYNLTANEIPRVREDWVYRATYNYAGKYMLEYNGAYTGSEKFGADKRFAFFQSAGLGWMISEESFMKPITFLNYLKVRANYGQIGDDGINDRFLYMSNWAYGGQGRLGVIGEGGENSPYTWYREASVGNPDVHWEVVTKANVGVDFEVFKGLVKGSVDVFRDERTEILLPGNNRAVPSYYGTRAPVANLGRVKNQGYEFELNFNHSFVNGMRLWSNVNMTHAINKVLFQDDPELLPDYQKRADFQLGQATTYVSQGYYNNWDELYASTMHNQNDLQKLPGNYHLLDYNADGVITAQDVVPFGYSGNPQNTYNATLGLDWKGFSTYVQFYGVNNVTRQVVFNSLGSQNNVVYEQGSIWSKDNPGADTPMPRWLSTPADYYRGSQYFYDGSYIRLKNAELAYTLDSKSLKRVGLNNIRLFVNGNNLYLWSKMPDDRESNFAGTGWASQGAYPTVKRYNIGANITF